MKIDEAIKMEKEDFKKRIEIRKAKGHDYATKEDILSNFKKVAQVLDILNVDISKSYGMALVYIILKIDRICNLLFRRKEKAINEAIFDSLLDLSNYIDLLKECVVEEKGHI